MFKSVEPLTKENHQDLRFTQSQSFNFAAKVPNAPICFSEFVQCAKYYPIVFLKDASLPIVILSLEKDKNNFVDPEGVWKVPYVPAHFRRYPFILAKTDGKDPAEKDANTGDAESGEPSRDKYIVCIDRAAPHFSTGQGDLMFTANGEFTELTTRGVNFLKQYQQEMAATTSIVNLLIEKELLVERQFNIGGQGRPVGGFRAVDMEKLHALDDSLLADWVRKGVISLIYAHMNSLQGIQTQ